MTVERLVYRAGIGSSTGGVDADPVTTEIVRHSLNSAANQMKRALVRTAFCPVIYEVLDFAVALFDRKVRLLAQAPSMPHFLGRLSFCVEGAIEALGREEALEPGDIVLYNVPYATGAHPQDAAVVLPIFLRDEELIGYGAVIGHWLDIGGKEPYSTDTVDVFQEGTIFPGLKLYRRGELVDDVYRLVLANSRVPKMVAGDLNAEVVAVRVGAAGLQRVVERFGRGRFDVSVEHMLDHGEALVRSYFERIPDGRYIGHGELDSNGIDDETVPFEVVVEVDGSTVRVDYSNAPDAQPGPINCPLPSTVSGSRMSISMLAGAGEAPNEGHFRPLEVVARPGSMFHPSPPSPCFLYGWPALQAMEVIYRALSTAMPTAVPAASGGDVCSLIWWGVREETGEPWAEGSPHPIGQGASTHGDGASSLMLHGQAATRFSPIEVWESKNPWLVERVELAADSGGPGRYRGGLGPRPGLPSARRRLRHGAARAHEERALGACGRAPRPAERRRPTPGRRHAEAVAKATRLPVPKGAAFELSTGGGGGYGDPAERDPLAVREDVREGNVTDEHARRHYPHAFEGAST